MVQCVRPLVSLTSLTDLPCALQCYDMQPPSPLPPTPEPGLPDGAVRLVGGRTPTEGRVVSYHHGEATLQSACQHAARWRSRTHGALVPADAGLEHGPHSNMHRYMHLCIHLMEELWSRSGRAASL